MDEHQAREKLQECRKLFTDGLYSPASWATDAFDLKQLPNGDWLAARPQVKSEGIVLKDTGGPVPFFGALGRLVPLLGLPQSRELLLGSASRGRYQIYERGLAVWEEFQPGNDLGYPVAAWNSPDERARRCRALVAFFDLRGFTTWSASRTTASETQEAVRLFENAFQDAFSGKEYAKLFAKGTGDGFMVVSEETWNLSDTPDFGGGQVKAFCGACAKTLINAQESLPPELAIGCGVTLGEITQLYILGRPDYVGPAVNEASKIQSVAYDELCIAQPALERLNADGARPRGKVLPGKGTRISPETLLASAEEA